MTVVIWAATARLVAENERIQTKIWLAQNAGLPFSCRACADQLGVTDFLLGLGIELRFRGAGLTEALKGEGKLLSVSV